MWGNEKYKSADPMDYFSNKGGPWTNYEFQADYGGGLHSKVWHLSQRPGLRQAGRSGKSSVHRSVGYENSCEEVAWRHHLCGAVPNSENHNPSCASRVASMSGVLSPV